MNAKILFRPVLLAAALGLAASGAFAQDADAPRAAANTMIGVSVATYQVSSARYQEVYGSQAAPIYRLSLSRTLARTGGLSLDVEGAIGFYSKTGLSTITHESAKLKMTPLSISGRLSYLLGYAQVFAGIGLDRYHYEESSPVADSTGYASGRHVTAGIYVIPPILSSAIRIKLYYKFTKVKASSGDQGIDLGGNEYGVGLSFGFDVLKKGVLIF